MLSQCFPNAFPMLPKDTLIGVFLGVKPNGSNTQGLKIIIIEWMLFNNNNYYSDYYTNLEVE